ncbi:MAG: anhydro-N-acetylmuramic acid kinase [Pseudomonadota bacterium]|nr:anhydro-N-acetylmuramic acid kinase [Pseudomonadota bacterium]
MNKNPIFKAVGLMSGTSLDGIDVAYIESDGIKVSMFGPWATYPYDAKFQDVLRRLKPESEILRDVEDELTHLHYLAVEQFLRSEGIDNRQIDIIGFHGHTIFHNPNIFQSVQIGDGKKLAKKLKTPVVSDFRSKDLRAGGQGAPLVPLFHASLAQDIKKPIAILNIGGVANVTWLGGSEHEILAFDTGPGNALIDDWMILHGEGQFDLDGSFASRGTINPDILKDLLSDHFFKKHPPKSLDRNEFSIKSLRDLNIEDGAATLTAFTVNAILHSANFFPIPVREWIVCGGGRQNKFLMRRLKEELSVPIKSANEIKWQGDAIEAQAFAYLAIRTILGLPTSLPSTTGASEPISGGILYSPA